MLSFTEFIMRILWQAAFALWRLNQAHVNDSLEGVCRAFVALEQWVKHFTIFFKKGTKL